MSASYHFHKYFEILAIALALLGCSSGAVETGGASQAAGFEGISSIENDPAGGWMLTWIPSGSKENLYGIFRGEAEDSVDFKTPIYTTSQSSYLYKPDQILNESRRCFGVRILGSKDKNKKVLCNNASPSFFTGLAKLEAQVNGSYLLSWNKLPVDDAKYWVFERKRDESYNFDEPAMVVSTDFYQTAVLERGQQFCYVVRVNHPGHMKDANVVELCTVLEPKIEFTDASAALATVSPREGEILATWNATTTPGDFTYKVFLNNSCTTPANCLWSRQSDRVSCTISNLQSDTAVQICVVAVDAAGRESQPVRANPAFPTGSN